LELVKGAVPWRDTYVGGLVSNLQVVELIACVAKNKSMVSDFLLHIRIHCRAMAAVPQLFLACVSDTEAILLVMFGGLWRVIKIYP
jgi:hypothetical protein